MSEELDQLQTNPSLVRLLEHYATIGNNDRDVWQDRLMQMDGVTAREMVKLHGELLAQEWVEQNTGMTPILKPGVAAACYRITAGGLRAVQQLRRQGTSPDDTRAGAA
jgi:hypothetical protein